MRQLTASPSTRRALAAHIDHRGRHRRPALRARLATVLDTLGTAHDAYAPTAELLDGLRCALTPAAEQQIWLALSVLTGRLPDTETVLRAVRTTRLDGPLAALAPVLSGPSLLNALPGRAWPTVTVLADRVLVDLHHTSRTDIATGIQRVARQTVARWHRDHRVELVGWRFRPIGLRLLTDGEQSRALRGGPATESDASSTPASIVVPWRCTYIQPELIADPQRTRSLQAMLRFSGTRGCAIGFDCVPLTSAETTADDMGARFSMMMSAMAYADRIATISEAAAVEYRGWREMLAGAGLRGPDITPVLLPVEAPPLNESALAAARDLLVTDELPMVLCVGSHEPRKNHLAVLHAAELLWRRGLQFSLVFVAGAAWGSERLMAQFEQLQQAGRPLRSVRALSDDMLWSAYRLSRCVVFPSLNEGYGLPVAESLASGTPVITSRFGSMQEIAGHGGALLVDPRNDDAIAQALQSLLTDDALHARLRGEAAALPRRTWDEYADRTWELLVTASTDRADRTDRKEAARS